jgi:transposase
MRGNRRHGHVIHMAAVTQIAHKHSDGHAYYQRKVAEGKTPSEARRALKRKIRNAIYARLLADERPRAAGPGGQPGNGSASSAAGSHPERQLFGQATPEPATTLRRPGIPGPGRRPGHPSGRIGGPKKALNARRPDQPSIEPVVARYDIRP